MFWSDGTSPGTRLVLDIARGAASSSAPTQLVAAGDVVYFTADDGVLGRELWKSDGSVAGTVRVADIRPGPRGSSPRTIVARGDEVFFVADDGVHGFELWRSDGTAAGTRLVVDLTPGLAGGTYDSLLIGPGGDLYFALYGSGLWRSDGTAAGTTLLGATGYVMTMAHAAGRLFLLAEPGLWTSDGTPSGTVPIPAPGSLQVWPNMRFAVVGSSVYFPARLLSPLTDMEVWKTDGTGPGTVRVKPGVPVLISGALSNDRSVDFLASGGLVYFWSGTLPAGQPWRTDGTDAGTFRLTPADVAGSFIGLANGCLGSFGGQTYFMLADARHRYLWRTNGQTTGTALVSDLPPQTPYPLGGHCLLTGGSSRLFLSSPEPALLPESLAGVWSSDGSAAGTQAMTLATVSSGPRAPSPLGDRVLFRAEADATGREWRAATASGKAADLLIESCAGTCSAYASELLMTLPSPPTATVYGEAAYFAHPSPGLGWEPWRTDGTPEGTALVADINPGPAGSGPGEATVSNGTAFFAAMENGSGLELWATDGTAAGTRRVRDIDPGPDSSAPTHLTDVAGRLFFLADDGATGSELWTSDGTESGTSLVADLTPGPGSSQLHQMAALEGRAFFLQYSSTTQRWTPWVSDGTSAGTVSLPAKPVPQRFAVAGGRAFFAAEDDDHGLELWASDGNGAALVRDLVPGPGDSGPRELAALGSEVFFSAFDPAHGVELWRSDGTAEGTVLVSDLVPGPGSSAPRFLTAADGRLWFSAETPEHGRELWSTTGLPAGTLLVQDIAAGAASSSPHSIAAADGWLSFAADDGVHGEEPWALPLLPTLFVEGAAVVEQPGGATALPRVRLAGTRTAPVTAGYATAAGTATSGEDFVAAAGVLTFAAGGPDAQSVPVAVLDDATDEDEQDLALMVSGVSGALVGGAGSGRVTIADDDGPPLLTASPATAVEGHEGPSVARFALRLHLRSERTASVAFATADGTATAPSDYAAASGTVTFPPGAVSRDVDVAVVGDRIPEPNEAFRLGLAAPQDLTLASTQVPGLILDDDAVDAAGLELSHGSRVDRVFAAPTRFRLRQQPYASYEVVLDAASGNALPASLDRLAADGSTVVQQAVADGTGASLSLRWQNASASAVDEERVAVAAACAPCTVAETYRLRVYETTLSGPRFNAVGSQRTVVVLFNRGASSVSGRLLFWSEAGALLHQQPFTLDGSADLVFDAASEPSLAGASGSITVVHDGRYGDLAGKAASLEPATGLAFDHPLVPRPR